MFPQRQQIPGFGAVAEALFRCIPRHGACERHCPFVPFPQWHRIPRFTAVAAFLLFRFPSCGTFPSSHLPKVCGFPAFSAHLPKVCNRPGPSVGPVRAFPFPAASSHLPKVCIFSAFSAHLPKVRTGMGCRITGCMYDFYTIFKKLDTCCMSFIQLNVFENCLSDCDTAICLIRHNFCNE